MFVKTFFNIIKPYTIMLNSLKTGFGKLLRNKRALLISLLVGAIFIFIAIYTYNTYVKPRLNIAYMPNKEYITGSGNSDDPGSSNGANDSATLYYFYTEWCPYCKSAMPEWDKFKEYAENINNTNSYQIVLNVIDCDKSPDLADKYEIAGYPTIKLIYKGKIYDYDAKPNKDNLIKFLETSVDFAKLENDASKKKKD